MTLATRHLIGHRLWFREPLADAAPSCARRALAALIPGSLSHVAREGVPHLAAGPAGWVWLAMM